MPGDTVRGEKWPTRAVMLVAVAATSMAIASCSGDATTATSTVAPRSTTAPTTVVESQPCTDGLAATLGVANSRFDIVPEPDIFECFATSSFRSSVTYEGTPLDPANPLTREVSVVSEQAVVDAEVRSYTRAVVDGSLYETVAIGDAVTMADGSPSAGAIPDEAVTAQGAVGSALADAVLEIGLLAAEVGEEDVNGIPTRHYRTDAAALALSFEESIARNGGGDVDLEFPDTQLDIWASESGYVVKATFAFDFAAATANGLPVSEVDLGGVTVADLIPAGTGTLTYELSSFGEPFDIRPPKASG